MIFVEGKRGQVKIILKNIPCNHCDFIAENTFVLGEHLIEKHGLLMIWSAPQFENLFYSIEKQNTTKVKP